MVEIAEPVTFREMSTALFELGFTERDILNAELTAIEFRRQGWSEDAMRVSIERMRRRALVLDEARKLLDGARPHEALIRELLSDPPRWGVILNLFVAVVRSQLGGRPHV